MVKLLDCTLRDGGYINNWEFGNSAIKDIIRGIEKTNVDILEIGFLKNETYDSNRTVFNNISQISSLIKNKKSDTDYAIMIEMVNPISLSMIPMHSHDSMDIIRVIVWKTKHNDQGKIVDALMEGYEYCRGIAEKGYKVCIQPARVDQYSDDEYIKMLELFQTLNPMAVYVVDSWGTQNTEQIVHYVELADKTLRKEIAVGYHGHNNLMQVFGTACAFVHMNLDRDFIVDGSIFGIGRGAGNLNLELFAKYMNETEGKNYNIAPMVSIYDKYIKSIFELHPWGYSFPYFLTASYNCNPSYGSFLSTEMGLSSIEIEEILSSLDQEDRIMFSKKKAQEYMNRLNNK